MSTKRGTRFECSEYFFKTTKPRVFFVLFNFVLLLIEDSLTVHSFGVINYLKLTLKNNFCNYNFSNLK